MNVGGGVTDGVGLLVGEAVWVGAGVAENVGNGRSVATRVGTRARVAFPMPAEAVSWFSPPLLLQAFSSSNPANRTSQAINQRLLPLALVMLATGLIP